MPLKEKVGVGEIKKIMVTGFDSEGDEPLRFEVALDDADLEVFRGLAELPNDEVLLGAFPLSQEKCSRIVEHILEEVRSRNLQTFLVFGEP